MGQGPFGTVDSWGGLAANWGNCTIKSSISFMTLSLSACGDNNHQDGVST